jgi:hypothetical protein
VRQECAVGLEKTPAVGEDDHAVGSVKQAGHRRPAVEDAERATLT